MFFFSKQKKNFRYLKRSFINRVNPVTLVETRVGGHTRGDVSNIGGSAGIGGVIVEDKVIIMRVTMELTDDDVLKP